MRSKTVQKREDESQEIKSKSLSPLLPIKMTPKQLAAKLRQEKLPELAMPKYESPKDRAEKYYNEYQRLFYENESLNNTLSEMIEKRNMLAQKFNTIKRMKVTEDTVKRKRRYARDIERLFHCPIEKCRRGYGSQGSLSHHVRLKHLEFYQSGHYQIFIQKFIDRIQGKAELGQSGLDNREQDGEKMEKKIKVEQNIVEVALPLAKSKPKAKKGESKRVQK